MTDDYKPCSVVDGVVHMCPTLLRTMEDSKRKGMSVDEFVNMKTLKTTRTAIVLRSGDFVKRGIILNFCPFCGEDIGSQFKGKDEEAAS